MQTSRWKHRKKKYPPTSKSIKARIYTHAVNTMVYRPTPEASGTYRPVLYGGNQEARNSIEDI